MREAAISVGNILMKDEESELQTVVLWRRVTAGIASVSVGSHHVVVLWRRVTAGIASVSVGSLHMSGVMLGAFCPKLWEVVGTYAWYFVIL